MVNIFSGLKACSDTNFVSYITCKEDDYNEGQDITVDELLDLASNKYKSLIKRGIFNEPTEDQKKIVALTAQIEKLGKATRSTSGKSGRGKSGSGKSGNGSTSGRSNQRGSRSGNSRDSTGQQYKTPAWKLKPPGPNEPKTKKVNGKTYHYCKYHKMWCLHKDADCKKKKNNNNSSNQNESNEGTGNDNSTNLEMDRNLQAVIEDDSSM